MKTQADAENLKDIFAEWISERPKWMQTAAADLAISRRMPSSDAICALADLCVAEANSGEAIFKTMPHGVFGASAGIDTFKLRKLSKVVGVNAIRENASLDFGSVDLSVVFGMNGSGKSGYARLLKHICGARHKSELLPNIFRIDSVDPSCEITIEAGSDSKSFIWKAEPDGIAQLRSIHIFDSTAAESYVDSKNVASYEPRRMQFLSALIKICDSVAAELANRKAALPKSLPILPLDYAETEVATFVSQLKDTTGDEIINAACVWSNEDQEYRQVIEKSLRQHDITARTQQLRLDERSLKIFMATYEALKIALSDGQIAKLLNLKRDAISKRKAASEDASRIFVGLELDGVGSVSWRLMWEEAKKYSQEAAYTDKKFPATDDGDLCVLCHQTLDDNARLRLEGFEAFVISGLEESASKAERDYSDAISKLPQLPGREKWDLDIDFLKLEPLAGKLLYESISERLLAIHKIETLEALNPVDWSTVDSAISVTLNHHAIETAALTELSKDGKQAELEKQLKALMAREWLSQQKNAIKNEVKRLAAVRRLERAEVLTKTNMLTSKKNDLAKDELEAGYRERFVAELCALGGTRLKVEPVAVLEGKGKINFKIHIKGAHLNAPTGSVLSEGESRIVALAAFLADITGSNHLTPFVFDDPVSSLDQEFEERVVQRLVDLAQTRQVVIFTHRLSLIALLEDAVDALKRVSASFPTLSLVTLRSFGGCTGRVEELDVRHKKPKAGFTAIRDQKLPKIREYEKTGNTSDYDSALKTACADFRILTERSIEKVILNGLMERFRRSIHTKHLKSLTKIDLDDCTLIDSMMTKYSKYEHSQPDELFGVLPTPDEVASDLDRVIDWIDEFEKRAT